LNFERSDYVKSLDELKPIPGAFKQIFGLAGDFPFLIVITNQSVVGRGIISESTLRQINEALIQAFFAETGKKIDRVYYCPHRPEDNCKCRKPKSELFERAARDFDLDLTKCLFLGDKDTDEEAARRIGSRFIRVKTNTAELIPEANVPA
jgi:histidinol-phosphate phosphatase family protein